jgi:2-phospho-L-lactate guanylyltransferase
MRATAILPVKRFGLAKQRLDAHVDAELRTALASAMLSDVLAALGETRTLDVIALVSAEPAVERHVDRARVHLVRDEVERGQSEAALAGLAWAAHLGAEVAVLVPGDCPVVDPDEIDDLVENTAEIDVAIVPDRHRQGTNALGLRPGARFTPQFGLDSLARHVRQAQRRGLRHSVLPLRSLALDVDTFDDLAALAAVIRRAPQRAPKTHALLQQMEHVSRLPGLSAA